MDKIFQITILDSEEIEIIENGIKTNILSKKKLVLKRDDFKPEDNKEQKIISIPKKQLKERNKKREDKLLKLVNERILNYIII